MILDIPSYLFANRSLKRNAMFNWLQKEFLQTYRQCLEVRWSSEVLGIEPRTLYMGSRWQVQNVFLLSISPQYFIKIGCSSAYLIQEISVATLIQSIVNDISWI